MANYCVPLIKFTLFTLTLLWLILGVVILWLGFTITNFSGDVKGIVDESFRFGAILLLLTCFVIFLFSFLGCYGVIKEWQCMLWTYGFIILLMVIVQCVGVNLMFKCQKNIEGEIRIGIEDNFQKYADSGEIRSVIDKFQMNFECCGSDSYTDWDVWLNTTDRYPPSCCGKSNVWCNSVDVINKGYGNGCVDKAMDKIHTVLGSLGSVAIVIILVQFSIVFAMCCLVEIRSKMTKKVLLKL